MLGHWAQVKSRTRRDKTRRGETREGGPDLRQDGAGEGTRGVGKAKAQRDGARHVLGSRSGFKSSWARGEGGHESERVPSRVIHRLCRVLCCAVLCSEQCCVAPGWWSQSTWYLALPCLAAAASSEACVEQMASMNEVREVEEERGCMPEPADKVCSRRRSYVPFQVVAALWWAPARPSQRPPGQHLGSLLHCPGGPISRAIGESHGGSGVSGALEGGVGLTLPTLSSGG